MNDDELRQALSILDVYKAQLDAMANQAQILQMSLEEVLRARETMRALINSKEGDDILIPVGASSFVAAKALGNGKAIVGIGSRMSVEKGLEDAVKYLDGNVNEITEALRKAGESITETETNARNLSLAVQQEYQRRQQ